MTEERATIWDGYVVGAALVALTLALFWPVYGFEFLRLDDNAYVSDNAHVQAGLTATGIAWAFTTTHAANWHPLTWLSHMLDCQFFGLNAGAHHLTNVAFHAANAVLLFLLLRLMTGALWRSALVAALFALHPLHVESVAWISERKDVLSTLFWLLTMLAYARYVARPGARRYLAALALFALGLMAKSMLVTLPCVLLLLDYWPLGRITLEDGLSRAAVGRARCLVLEKVPFLALSAVSSLITMVAQQRGSAVVSQELLGFRYRLANAAVAYVRYIGKMVWPHDLAAIYMHPRDTLTASEIGAALVVLVLLTVLALALARRRPYFIVGWLWFVGTLVPVIGLVQVGSQAMADRYTYVPLTGLFIAIAWAAGDVSTGRLAVRNTLITLLVIALGVLAGSTARQLRHWRDTETVFAQTLRVAPDSFLAHKVLAELLMGEQRFEEAVPHYAKVLEVTPDDVGMLNNYGAALLLTGQPSQAAEVFRQVLRHTPADATAQSNLGVAFIEQGEFEKATPSLNRALEIDPNCDKARQALVLIRQARQVPAPHEPIATSRTGRSEAQE